MITERPITVPGCAAFIASARRQLGLRRVHLVFHDFGGPFGLQWAADHLADVASVTIVNAPPVQGYRWYILAKAWRTPVLGELVNLTLIRPVFQAIAALGHPKGLPRSSPSPSIGGGGRGVRAVGRTAERCSTVLPRDPAAASRAGTA